MAAEGVSRMALAEFVLALPILGKASLVSIGPHTSEGAILEVRRGGNTVFACRLTSDQAAAAVTRIAWIAALDPLEEHGSLASLANVARLRVRAGDRAADLLVSVGATAPSPVTRVVVRALAKRLEQRPQSAVEFMLDLDRALSVLERPSWRKWLPA